jgi:hypothetical protein
VAEYEEVAEEEVSIEPRTGGSSFWVLGLWVLVLGSGLIRAETAAQSRRDYRILSCDGPFSPKMTPDTLRATFGAANVTTDDIQIGEGDVEKGTVLFPTSAEDRVEILWRDAKLQQDVRLIVVRGEKTRWKTAEGLTLGVGLRTIERLNRRPFRLLGFGWDYAGTTMSWSNGLLDNPKRAGCDIRARFSIGDRVEKESLGPWYGQVMGDKEFASGHPAMQALDPVVYEIFIEHLRDPM